MLIAELLTYPRGELSYVFRCEHIDQKHWTASTFIVAFSRHKMQTSPEQCDVQKA
jgi:hypothetical protein